ncbi:alpha/beta hydrolase [Granulicella tundricola]|nr:alpha/beta hydrolase-fold protein [Granulicella tundricola]
MRIGEPQTGVQTAVQAEPASLVRMETEPEDRIERLELFELHSAVLPEPETRCVCVYLPECYESEPERHFPVFYLHDGQNLIDGRTSYIPGRTWRVGETADRMIAEGLVEPVILVGVANTGLRRMAEYTPTKDFRMGGGDGKLYGRLLVEELKPHIDHEFRTLRGAVHTGLGGSSLGGLISLYLGLGHPETFGQLAVMSPSIWWDHRSLLQFVKQARPRPETKIWLDIGTGEGMRHVRDTELLERLLIQQGWRPGEDLQTLIVPDAVHDEDAWAARFDQVLRFLFPAR